MYQALSILRTDPASAHGFAPAQLLLGRPVVYPFELTKREIDMTGNQKYYDKILSPKTNKNTIFGFRLTTYIHTLSILMLFEWVNKKIFKYFL